MDKFREAVNSTICTIGPQSSTRVYSVEARADRSDEIEYTKSFSV